MSQLTGMATQKQLDVILAGNRIATRVLWSRDNWRVNKDENGERKLCLSWSVSLLSKVYINCHVHKFGIYSKNKVGDRPTRLNEKKSDRELERKIRIYLLEEQHEIFLGAVRKWEILAATKVKMSEWKKVNNNRYDISSIKRVTRKFLEVSRCGRAKKRQRNVQKKCAARAKLFFLLNRPIVVVFSPFSLPSPLSITWFYILFEQTINIIESFTLSLG